MKIERQVRKMINSQLFSYPEFNLKLDKGLIDPNAFPGVEKVNVIWGSLLGKNNKELLTISLLKAQKFATFVEKTREEFRKNHSDLRKFPKMNDDDWK